MQIMSFIIPKDLRSHNFIQSLHAQFDKTKVLSYKQICALKDILEIDEEFFNWDYECQDEHWKDDYQKLKEKLIRNRFRSIKNKNKCVRAMQSVIDGCPNNSLIDDALGRNFTTWRR